LLPIRAWGSPSQPIIRPPLRLHAFRPRSSPYRTSTALVSAAPQCRPPSLRSRPLSRTVRPRLRPLPLPHRRHPLPPLLRRIPSQPLLRHSASRQVLTPLVLATVMAQRTVPMADRLRFRARAPRPRMFISRYVRNFFTCFSSRLTVLIDITATQGQCCGSACGEQPERFRHVPAW
jgi:hypothetical protein